MEAILTRAGCFVGLIVMGYLLRRVGFFKQEDFALLSKIVIKITLTAAIVVSFAGNTLDGSMLVLTLMGFSFGVLLIAAAWLLNRRAGRETQAFAIVNTAGCNIGNFVLPFAQTFLGPIGTMAVSLFDAGNSVICLGGAYGVASFVKEREGQFPVRPILKAMSRSVPLMTYVVMTVLSALHLALPGPVLEYASIVANANAFLAMLMIGVGFRMDCSREQLASVAKILLVRYGLGIAFAVLAYQLLPFPAEYRQALVILFLSPVASAAPAFTALLKSDYGLSCTVNSFSIVISIALIVSSLLVIL